MRSRPARLALWPKSPPDTYDCPSRKFKLLGITGTNGKTTVTCLLKSILELGQFSVGLVGTLGYQTALQTFQAVNTTPGSLELERLFAITGGGTSFGKAAGVHTFVMKVLTIITTIFMPLTFIAGIYGMNFKYMPELEWRWGYPVIWGVIVLIGVFMVVYFKKKRWIYPGGSCCNRESTYSISPSLPMTVAHKMNYIYMKNYFQGG